MVVQHGDVAHDLHARRVHGHQHHAVAVVAVFTVGIRVAAQHDEQLAVRVRRTGDEPLAAAEYQVIALAPHRGLQVGGVGRGHIGLAHRKGRAHLAVQQRHQPARALGGRGKAVQQLDVAGVWRLAVEHLGRPGQAAHGLGQRRVVQVGQARARLIIPQRGQEQVPQTLLTRQRLEVFDKRRRVVARRHGRVPGGVVGQQIAVHESQQAITQFKGQGESAKSMRPL